MVENIPANVGAIGNMGLIPRWGRSPGGRNGSSLQYSCLNNPMDIGAWWATVHVVAKQSDTTERLSTHIHKMLQHISSNEKQTYRLKNGKNKC